MSLSNVLLALVAANVANAAGPLGVFFRNVTNLKTSIPLHAQSKWMSGMVHYRLLPGGFPEGMNYHFDGLSAIMSFNFTDDSIEVTTKFYESVAEKDYDGCFFFGSGTTGSHGLKPCFRNPAVNLLPIDDQLWLTIDTFAWGRVDPTSLDTLPGMPDAVFNDVLTLNAHPPCDPHTRECFVQHPCPPKPIPLSNQVCFSKIITGEKDISLVELTRANMSQPRLLQHSHSPCLTPNYLVSFGALFNKSSLKFA